MSEENKKIYLAAAHSYIKNLQTHEKANSEVKEVEQGSEGD